MSIVRKLTIAAVASVAACTSPPAMVPPAGMSAGDKAKAEYECAREGNAIAYGAASNLMAMCLRARGFR